MGPAAIILAAASLAGGILGGRRKTIDPNWLYQHFGPNVVSNETITLMNNLLNSPYGESIMAQADEQAQQFGRDTNRAAAMAGFGPGGGADTGASIFATSAAKGATPALERGVKSDFYKMALPIAQNMVSQRMNAYLNNLGGYQDDSSRIWQAIGNAAGTAGSLISQPDKNTGTTQDYGTLNQMPSSLSGGISGPGYQVPYDPFETYRQSAKLPDVNPILKANRFSAMQGAIQPGGYR